MYNVVGEVLLDIIVYYKCGSTNGWAVKVLGYRCTKSQWLVISGNGNINFSTRFY